MSCAWVFLWMAVGYYRRFCGHAMATTPPPGATCYAGFGVAILLSLWAFIFLDKDNYTTLIMTFLLVIFIFVSCQSELQRIESGMMEDDTFGF